MKKAIALYLLMTSIGLGAQSEFVYSNVFVWNDLEVEQKENRQTRKRDSEREGIQKGRDRVS